MTDNPAYEFAKATVAAKTALPSEEFLLSDEEQACVGPEKCPEVADRVRVLFLGILEACEHNANRIAIALMRAAGMSYRDTGSALHMSQEGVRRHVQKIASRNPALGDLLRLHYSCETVAIGEQDIFDIEKRALQQLKGIYDGQ